MFLVNTGSSKGEFEFSGLLYNFHRIRSIGGTYMEELFKALSCKWRIEILKMLEKGEICQCEILKKLPIDASTLSRHLKILRYAGLILERKEGTRKLLRLKDERILKVVKMAEEMWSEEME